MSEKNKYIGRSFAELKKLKSIQEMGPEEFLFFQAQSAPKETKEDGAITLIVSGTVEATREAVTSFFDNLKNKGKVARQRSTIEAEADELVEAMRKDPTLMSAIRAAKNASGEHS